MKNRMSLENSASTNFVNHDLARLSDQERMERELRQSAILPREIRRKIETSWSGDPIQFFALIDVDSGLNLTESWLVLGKNHVGFSFQTDEGWKVESRLRKDIQSVHDLPGLSLNRLTLGSRDPDVPMFVFRYSNRQKKAVSHIIFCIEQELKARQDSDNASAENDVLNLDRFRNRTPEDLYLEAVLSPLKEGQALNATSKLSVIWRLLGYLLPYKRRVITGMGAAVMMTLLNLAPPFLTGRLIDRVMKPFELGKINSSAAMQTGWMTILALALIYMLRESFAWVRLRWMSTVGESVASNLREAVYTHIHRLSLSYFSSKQTGSLINRVSSDTDRIWDFVAFGVVEVTTSVMMLCGLSTVLLYIDVRLGLLVTLPIPFVLFAIVAHGRRMQGLFLRAWRKWSALTDCLSDTIPGVRVVKAFNREVYETEKFKARNDDVYGEFVQIHVAWTSFWPLLMLVIQSIVLAVWVSGLPRVLGESGHKLLAGDFIAFLLYLTMLMQPIEVIGQMARMINRATSSAYRVFEVLDTEPQMRDDGACLRLDPVKGKISFENVYFTYDGVRPILRNLSFSVTEGELIGLVGPSGSGKTTIINLLARFYDVSDGRVLVDGVDIRQLDSGHYRQQIGMVLQDPYLFHGSIVDNIRYARPQCSLSDVIHAAQVANAHKFICQLPHGYDTVVGERGHTLSGGERQRISIARAVLLDPKILILDEATSAVDTETERQIQDALNRLVKGRTVFAIAHRLSTLAKADRIFVMKEGRLVESGRHAELQKIPGGVFAELWRLQHELHVAEHETEANKIQVISTLDTANEFHIKNEGVTNVDSNA